MTLLAGLAVGVFVYFLVGVLTGYTPQIKMRRFRRRTQISNRQLWLNQAGVKVANTHCRPRETPRAPSFQHYDSRGKRNKSRLVRGNERVRYEREREENDDPDGLRGLGAFYREADAGAEPAQRVAEQECDAEACEQPDRTGFRPPADEQTRERHECRAHDAGEEIGGLDRLAAAAWIALPITHHMVPAA